MPVTRAFFDNAPANWYNHQPARASNINDLRWEILAAGRDTTNQDLVFFAPVQFQPASWANSSFAFQIDQNNNAVAIDIDTEATTADGINLSIAAMTTGIGLDIPDGDLLTTGQLARFASNAPATDTRSLVTILNDNTAATGTTVLDLDQDAAANALFINHDAATGASIYIDAETTTDTQGVIRVDGNVLSTGTGLRIDADRLTTGSIAVLSSNGTDTGTKSLVQIIADNTLATGTTVLELQQDAAQNVLFIDQDAITGASIYIDAETTTDTRGVIRVDGNVLSTGTGLRVDADRLTTGSIAVFSSNGTDTGTKSLVQMISDNTSATGTTVLELQQDAAQNVLFIDQDAITGASIYIDAETTTDTQGVIRVDGNVLSTGTGLRVDANRLTTGSIAVFSSNGTDTGTKSLVQIISDNTSATGTTVLELQQDAAQNVLFIDQDAITGASIYIDAETTTDTQGVIRVDANVVSSGTALRVDADRLTTGSIAIFSDAGTDTGAKQLVQIINDALASSGTVPLLLQQDSTPEFLRFSATGTAAANTQAVFTFTGYTTVSTFPQFGTTWTPTATGTIRFQAAAANYAIPFYPQL